MCIVDGVGKGIKGREPSDLSFHFILKAAKVWVLV